MHATIENFCRATSERGRISLTPEEREDLHHEGLAILYQLATKFVARMDGYEQDGRFSGFAAMFLPRKLGDAWHRMHAEHQHVTQPDGKRRWVYGEKAVSLEALTADDPDRHDIMTSAPESDVSDLGRRVHDALVNRSHRELGMVIEVAKLTGSGMTEAQIAAALHITEPTVSRYWRKVVRARPTPTHMFAKTSELRAALESLAEADATAAAQVGELLAQNASAGDVAQILGLELGMVRDHMEAIRRVWHQIETEGSQL